jgi:predicted pyridoxine 5'-phosphate oxidase superfamily flavin-nucleotide-binding protein
MLGIIPTCMSTASQEGEPNVTFISQVWYVDSQHLAVSCQFFNKTTRNVRENPKASIMTTCPHTYAVWRVTARYVESRTTGPLYDEMADQLAVIASMVGLEDVFRLLSADIYAVELVELLHPGVPAVNT